MSKQPSLGHPLLKFNNVLILLILVTRILTIVRRGGIWAIFILVFLIIAEIKLFTPEQFEIEKQTRSYFEANRRLNAQ